MILNQCLLRFGLLYILAVLCIGCAKDLGIDLEPPPARLIVKGTLSPQRGLVVQVFQTLNPYEWIYRDSNAHYVENAVIEIYRHDTLIDRCHYLGDSYYQSTDPTRIIGGQQYSITVSAPGLDTVRVRSILVPKVPPTIKEFNIAPNIDQPPKYSIENLLTFSILNNPEYTVYHIKETYDDNPEEVLGIHIFRDDNIVCEDLNRLFSNKCYDEEWIERRYHFTWYYDTHYNSEYSYPIPQEWIYFHIGIIDPAIIEYDAAKDGGYGVESGYTEPALSKGNVEGGLGYVVGKNMVTKRYKVP